MASWAQLLLADRGEVIVQITRGNEADGVTPKSDKRLDLLKPLRLLAVGVAIAQIGSSYAQTAVTITPPNLTGAVAGTARGAASVDPASAAHYSMPLTVPPGTASSAWPSRLWSSNCRTLPACR